MITIKQALQQEGATPDDLTAFLDVLGAEGYNGDMAAGRLFVWLKR